MQEVGAGTLLEAALTRENLQAAWKRVKANKGAAGVDGLDIEHTQRLLQTRWPQIRQELLAGKYRPSPVRRVMIPKPDGSQRELGMPMIAMSTSAADGLASGWPNLRMPDARWEGLRL